MACIILKGNNVVDNCKFAGITRAAAVGLMCAYILLHIFEGMLSIE